MIESRIKRQLDSIDWDFPVTLPGLTKSPHWYPGTFPSSLPATLIQSLSAFDDIVFDPYGGIGTTAAESIRLGRKAWVADINPVAVLASYFYCALIIVQQVNKSNVDILIKYMELLIVGQEADDLLGHEDASAQISVIDEIISRHMRPTPEDFLKSVLQGGRGHPQRSELSRWFHEKTLEELKGLAEHVYLTEESPFARVFFTAMISANMRALCSQNKSWGHIADNVYPKQMIYKDVKSQLLKWLKTTGRGIKKLSLEGGSRLTGIRYWGVVHDWGGEVSPVLKPRGGADVIITSPPYGDAIDYIFSQKLSLYFMGYAEDEILSLCSREIGARRKRFKAGSREQWAQQMADAAVFQGEYVSSGYMVTILPHKNHGREAGIKLMKEGLKEHGWSHVFEMDRSISQKKARQSWTSIKQETINIFKRE